MSKFEVTIEGRNGREILWTRLFWCNASDKMDAISMARNEYPNGSFFNARAK